MGNLKTGESSEEKTILAEDKRQDKLSGRRITVVEGPAWQHHRPAEENIELLKKDIMLRVSQCLPGPHAVLVVVHLEATFKDIDKRMLEECLNLLGDKVWSHTIVLFNFGDSLRDTTIEQHIEREGEALQWLVEKCGNRYHVFDSKERGDGFQVTELLEKIEEMLTENCAEDKSRHEYR